MGCPPRHPPRAFSLGLLAPRCLCALLLRAPPAVLGGGAGSVSDWGKEGILPPARSPLRSCQLTPRLYRTFFVCFPLCLACTGLQRPPIAQPTSSFSIFLSWCRFRFWILGLQESGGAHPS